MGSCPALAKAAREARGKQGSSTLASPFACFGCWPLEMRLYADSAPGDAKVAWPPSALQSSLWSCPGRFVVVWCPQREQTTATPLPSAKVAMSNLCFLESCISLTMLEAMPGHFPSLGGTAARAGVRQATHNQRLSFHRQSCRLVPSCGASGGCVDPGVDPIRLGAVVWSWVALGPRSGSEYTEDVC